MPRLKALYIIAPQWFEPVYSPADRAALDREVEWVAPPQSSESIRANLSLLRDVEVIFAGWGMAVTDEAFLAAAPKLRAIFHAAGTIRYFTTDAFWQRNILITSGAAINAIPVAEYTLATILFSLRHGWHYERQTLLRGAFPTRTPMPGAYGTTVGLVSLGMVARRVCELLRPFDLRVIAYDPFASDADFARLGAQRATLDEVFAHADVVSLHAPWLKETEGLITGKHFASMKPGAAFINTARGAIVNEPEMIAVLQSRPDLYAILDVTWPEPPVAGSPLYTLPNVVLTPHIAGTSDAELVRLGHTMVEEFGRWQRGEPLLHAISAEQAKRLA